MLALDPSPQLLVTADSSLEYAKRLLAEDIARVVSCMFPERMHRKVHLFESCRYDGDGGYKFSFHAHVWDPLIDVTIEELGKMVKAANLYGREVIVPDINVAVSWKFDEAIYHDWCCFRVPGYAKAQSGGMLRWIPTSRDLKGPPPLSECLVQTGRIVRSNENRGGLRFVQPDKEVFPLSSAVTPGEKARVATGGRGTLTVRMTGLGEDEAKELDLFEETPRVGSFPGSVAEKEEKEEERKAPLVRVRLPLTGSIRVPASAPDQVPLSKVPRQ